MCASAVEKAWPLSLWRRCLHGARRFGEAPSGRRTADGRRGLLLGSGLLPAWWSKIQQGRKGKGSKGQPCLAATEKTQGILAWTKKEKNSIRRLSYCTALRVTAYVYLQFGTAGWPRPRHLTSGPHHYETRPCRTLQTCMRSRLQAATLMGFGVWQARCCSSAVRASIIASLVWRPEELTLSDYGRPAGRQYTSGLTCQSPCQGVRTIHRRYTDTDTDTGAPTRPSRPGPGPRRACSMSLPWRAFRCAASEGLRCPVVGRIGIAWCACNA